ncbi:MAG: hypothetical protein K0S49_7 [Microbacterium sp.]|jgi:hypothetical protein|nr:hypothetical protein [Microbacterium sp.]
MAISQGWPPIAQVASTDVDAAIADALAAFSPDWNQQVAITRTAYDALGTPVASTFYAIDEAS